MLVCDVTQAFTPTSGGVRTYLSEKSKYIEQFTNWEHLIIIPGERDAIIRRGRLITAMVAGPLVPGCAPYRCFLRMDKVYALLQEYKPEIIELGSGYLVPWAIIAYRARHKCRLVAFYHTDYPDAYVKPFVKKIAGRWAGEGVARIAYCYLTQIHKQFDITLAGSPALLVKLRKLGVTSSRYLPLGVDLELFNPDKRSTLVRSKLGVRGDDILLIYAGRLDVEKRIHVLLEAFSRLSGERKYVLAIAGNGPCRELVETAARCDASICFLPFVEDRRELARLMASADMYVTAGPYESFGLSIIEAQACGLAVAGVRSGALVERVPEELGLLAEPDSSESLAQTIHKLSTNGFQQKGVNARIYVASRFSWASTFAQLFTLYEKMGNVS